MKPPPEVCLENLPTGNHLIKCKLYSITRTLSTDELKKNSGRCFMSETGE